jgi:hypothetical protein
MFQASATFELDAAVDITASEDAAVDTIQPNPAAG